MHGLRLIFLALLLLSAGTAWTQVTPEKARAPRVRNIQGAELANPWAGGMNSCQYGLVDLDLDGTKDLVVFDRVGDRLMTFIKTGGEGNSDFSFRPEYSRAFPNISSWMIMADYNGDGKEDIFTYSPGWAGMLVYKNVSSAELRFELEVSPYLTSSQGGIYTNILVTYADYPGIADLDGDGDLDILTFWGLGSFVEMHRNLSMEKYGHADSLDYEKVGYCWGFFAESDESNVLTLDTCLGLHLTAADGVLLPHTGSTFAVTDLQGDGLPDVLLGDVDYPNIIALYNDGSADTAHIGSYEQDFPSSDTPVHLFSMPAASLLDIDGDGLKDLLVSPFDPNPFTSANKFSSWLYRDAGTREVPDFTLGETDFLQGGMIDAGAGACPVLADYDGDGLQDLFIGNYGYYDSSYYDQFMILHTVQTGKIAIYRNSGSPSSPVFSYVTDDFASASSLGTLGLMPAFADLDGDGDLDMLTGRKDGNLLLFKNIADPGQPMIMQLAVNGFANIDIGDFSAAQLFDLDRDGRTDLILGEKDGNLNYYKGVDDSPWMGFIHVTDSLGGINVTNPNVSLDGYSVPFFFRDALDRTLLVVGSEDGKLFFYTNIDGNLDGDFSESDTLGTMLGQEDWNPDRGYRTAAALTDLDGDGFPEMLAGNFSGGLEYFSRSVSPEVMAIAELPDLASSVKIYPNPARCKVSIEVKNDTGIEVAKIEVYSAQGLMIRNIDLPGTIFYNLNTDGFEPGIYYLTITLKSRNGRLTNINKKLAFFN